MPEETTIQTEDQSKDETTVIEHTTQEGKTDRPAWLDPKFETPEALAAAYKELETKLGTTKPTEETQKTETTPQQTAQLNYDKYNKEIETSGTLSEASIAEVQKLYPGLPKETIEQYVEGIKARTQVKENDRKAILEEAGGEAEFQKMAAWAMKNLPKEEIDAFNENTSKSAAAARLAIAGLRARYEQVNGVTGKRIHGSKGTGGVIPFANRGELANAMADKRYDTDQSYRESVYERLAAAKQQGIL